MSARPFGATQPGQVKIITMRIVVFPNYLALLVTVASVLANEQLSQLVPPFRPEKISNEITGLLPLPVMPIKPPPMGSLFEERLMPPFFEESTPAPRRCKGDTKTLTSTSGIIFWRSPWKFNERNSKDVDTCYWFIHLPHKYRIRLTFQYFNVAESPDCTDDHLIIFDITGNGEDSPSTHTPIGTYCGISIPRDIESRGSEVLIGFRSFSHRAGKNSGHQFKLSYKGFIDEASVDNEKDRNIQLEDFPRNDSFSIGSNVAEPSKPGSDSNNHNHESNNEPKRSFRPVVHQILGRGRNELRTIRPEPNGEKVRPMMTSTYSTATVGGRLPEIMTRRNNRVKMVPRNFRYSSADQRLNNEENIGGTSREQQDYYHVHQLRRLLTTTRRPEVATEPIFRLRPIAETEVPATEPLNHETKDNSNDGNFFPDNTNRNSAKCNGRIRLLTAESGQLASPNFGYGNYYANDLCFWQIIAPEGKRIRLGFSFLMLQPESGCYNDYLNIYDGASETGPLIAAFCGSQSPPPDREILTSKNTAFIKFSTDNSGEFPGFQVGYEFFDSSVPLSMHNSYQQKETRTSDLSPTEHDRQHHVLSSEEFCGGRRQLLFAPRGIIKSPGLAPSSDDIDAYGDDATVNKAPDECFWLISAPADDRIRIKFKYINLRDTYKCTDDSVSLYEGRADYNDSSAAKGGIDLGRLLAKFCGGNLPMAITSETNELLLGYMTRGGSVSRGHGFSVEYEQIQSLFPVCNGESIELTSSPGYISTPNLGRGKYGANDQCSWTLTAKPHQRIRLVFEKFAVESSPNCVKDALIIFEVGSSSQTRSPLRDLCGAEIPAPVLSQTNAIEIKFISDSNGEDKGIKIFYEFVDANFRPELPNNRLSKPDYGTPHRQPSSLLYQHQQQRRHPERLYRTRPPLTTFSSPGESYYESEAEDDYYDTEEPMVAVPKIVQGPEGFVAILGRENEDTDSENQANNMVGRCGNSSSLLTDPSGAIESPGIRRGYYPHSDDCQWLIITEAHLKIRLYFEMFDIELEPMCSHDSLTVYDGPSAESSEPLGIYCGQGQPEAIESTGPYMMIQFHSDIAGSGKGFKLFYNVTAPPNEGPTVIEVVTPAPSNFYQLTSLPPATPQPLKEPEFSGGKIDGATMHFIKALIQGVMESKVNSDSGKGVPSQIDFPQIDIQNLLASSKIETARSSEDPPMSLIPVAPELPLTPSTPMLATTPMLVPLEVNTPETYTWPSAMPYTWPAATPPPPTSRATTQPPRPEKPLYSAIKGQCKGRIGVIVLNALVGKPGSLASPNFGVAPYADNDVCRWEIRSPTPQTRIRLRFLKFHLENGSPVCRNDFVEIFDGPGANFPVIGRYCGEKMPPSLISNGNQLAIRFVSDGMLSYAGFYAEFNAEPIQTMILTTPPNSSPYIIPAQAAVMVTKQQIVPLPQSNDQSKQERCDGRLHQLVATSTPQFFTSPNFGPGRAYPVKDVCYWIITTPQKRSTRVRITFRYFELQPPSPRCNPGDSVSVFDGPAETAPLLAVHCGASLPSQLISQTGSSLFVKFQSDGFGNFPGFIAAFDEFQSVSPMHSPLLQPVFRPRRLSKMAVPRRVTRAPRTTRTTTAAMTTTEYSEYYDDDEYYYDDEYDEISTTLPPTRPRRSKNNVLKGNKQPQPEKWSCRGEHPPVSLLAVKTPRFINSHQRFSLSEDSSSFYAPNLDCSWVITVAPNQRTNKAKVTDRLRLTFDEFRVERGLSETACLSDYVVIFDGPTDESETVRKLCGDDGKDFSFVSDSQTVLLKFHTDRTVEDLGFRLRFEVVSVNSANQYYDNLRPCGGRFMRLPPASSNQVQMFLSPNYGNGRKYFPNDSCKWLVVSSQQMARIRLRFVTFFLENRTPNCANDHIIVYDGANENAPVIGKFCGLSAPPELVSSGRKMMVRFFSDNSIEYSGFSAEYSSIQEHLTKEQQAKAVGHLPFLEEASESKKVSQINSYRLVTQSLDLSLGEYSGGYTGPVNYHRSPRDRSAVRSASGAVQFSYSTPPLVKASFFQPPRCNGQVLEVRVNSAPSEHRDHASAVVIVSPNYYGHQYINNDECMWSVSASQPDSKIRFHFDDFDVQYSEGCYKDRLLIYDGGISGPRVYGPFCGQMHLPDIETQTNKALIKFNTDDTTEMRGFRISLIAVVAEPARTLVPDSTTTTTTTTWQQPTTTKPETTTTTTKTTTLTPKPTTVPLTVAPQPSPPTNREPIFASFIETDHFNYHHGNKNEPGNKNHAKGHYSLVWEPGFKKAPSPTEKLIYPTADENWSWHHPPHGSSIEIGGMSYVSVKKEKPRLIPISFVTESTSTTQRQVIAVERLHEPCHERLFEFDSLSLKTLFATPADEASGRYFANDICLYRVRAPIGKRVRLEFMDPFDLEQSLTCLYDQLKVYDGSTEDSPLAGIFCGMTPPEPFISTESSVFLRFQSDSTQNKAGFIVKFSFVA